MDQQVTGPHTHELPWRHVAIDLMALLLWAQLILERLGHVLDLLRRILGIPS